MPVPVAQAANDPGPESDYIQRAFGTNGLLSRQIDGYAERPQQIRFAQAVFDAINTGSNLVVEGNTGLGKALGYLIPAIEYAVRTRKQVVVSTAGIALQLQLVHKDIPLAKKATGLDCEFALLKGRGNYLCLDNEQDERKSGTCRSKVPKHIRMHEQILDWATQTKTGDVAELPFEPPAEIWGPFTSSSHTCIGKECGFHHRCFVFKARTAAKKAHLVVTNHSQLCADALVFGKTGKRIILPPYKALVVDEAHKLGEAARGIFGARLTEGSVKWIAKRLKSVRAPELQNELTKKAEQFFDALGQYRKSRDYNIRLRSTNPVPWTGVAEDLRAAEGLFSFHAKGAKESDDKKAAKKLSNFATRCGALQGQVHAAMNLEDDNSVYFIEENHRKRAELCSKPVDVGELLRENLFRHTKSTVLCSATLAVGGRFEQPLREVGLDNAREFVVGSPFNHAARALLVIPREIPDPNTPKFPAAVARVAQQVVDMNSGGTLFLHTSFKGLNNTYEAIKHKDRRILRQGEAPKGKLIEQFRDDVSSVLLATASFWEGVDVPGRALSCVVIDRLPFASPDDPIVNAIAERDRYWFGNHSLPKAIIAFKQGFGRLMRRVDDCGVVVVLDRRIITKRYGSQFLKSVPNVPRSDRLSDIYRFLSEIEQ